MGRYAKREHLAASGLSEKKLANTSSEEQERAIDSAENDADSYISGAGMTPPLLVFPAVLTNKVVDLAVYYLFEKKGFNPTNESDALIITRRDNAIGWFRDLARNPALLPGAVGSNQAGARTSHAYPIVLTRPRR